MPEVHCQQNGSLLSVAEILPRCSVQEVKRIQSVPLVIGQFLEAVDENTGIVGSTTGNNYYVRILSTINREQLKPNASVALHRHSNALVEVRHCLFTHESSGILAL